MRNSKARATRGLSKVCNPHARATDENSGVNTHGAHQDTDFTMESLCHRS